MGLAVKQGESITFMIDGEDEEEACAALEAFCRNNF
jgi:phosphotransferase system HPr-like phosphotransfer protein